MRVTQSCAPPINDDHADHRERELHVRVHGGSPRARRSCGGAGCRRQLEVVHFLGTDVVARKSQGRTAGHRPEVAGTPVSAAISPARPCIERALPRRRRTLNGYRPVASGRVDAAHDTRARELLQRHFVHAPFRARCRAACTRCVRLTGRRWVVSPCARCRTCSASAGCARLRMSLHSRADFGTTNSLSSNVHTAARDRERRRIRARGCAGSRCPRRWRSLAPNVELAQARGNVAGNGSATGICTRIFGTGFRWYTSR